jgi:hypothetical protein
MSDLGRYLLKLVSTAADVVVLGLALVLYPGVCCPRVQLAVELSSQLMGGDHVLIRAVCRTTAN